MSIKRVRLSVCLATGMLSIAGAALRAHAQTKYLYVTNETTSNISVYSVNVTTGQLNTTGTVATSPMPHWIQFSPSGNFAYVVSDDGNAASLTTYAVNTSSGGLTQVGSLALTPATFPTPKISPSGTMLLLTDGRNDQVNQYSLDQTTGAPALVKTSSSPNIPWSVAFSSNQAFVVGNGNNLMVLPLNQTAVSASTGAPSALRPSTPAANLKSPSAQMAFMHPKIQVMYITDPIGQTISSFTVSSAGSTTSLGAPVGIGVSPSDTAIDPGGKFLYVSDWSTGRIAALSLNSSGVPTLMTGSPSQPP